MDIVQFVILICSIFGAAYLIRARLAETSRKTVEEIRRILEKIDVPNGRRTICNILHEINCDLSLNLPRIRERLTNIYDHMG